MSNGKPLESFIQSDGTPTFGHLEAIPRSLELERFRYRNEMDKPASKLRKYFDFKQFQFVSLATPEYLVGIAIADIRYLASGFCYLFDIKNNKLIEQQWLRPFSVGSQTESSSWSSEANLADNAIKFSIQQGTWHVHFVTGAVNAALRLQPELRSEPLMLCTPTGYSGWTYTQKHNGLAVTGNLFILGQEQDVNNVSAGYDFSAGFMRKETSWRWASINHLGEEQRLGLNLAVGVNESGYCENVVWVNGERHLIPPVQFHFSRDNPYKTWRITSLDGRVDLAFTPLNCRSERKNFWFLKSNFRQYIGYFSGFVIDGCGIRHKLDDVVGLTEDHYAKW
jgi:hypothetical protein